jgi:hypothetical protein
MKAAATSDLPLANDPTPVRRIDPAALLAQAQARAGLPVDGMQPPVPMAANQPAPGYPADFAAQAAATRSLAGYAAPAPAAPPQAAPAPLPTPRRAGAGRNESPVTVATTPAGATITFDRDPLLSCTSPCSISLPPGRHAFSVAMAGYRQELRVITVGKTDQSHSINLIAVRGSLLVVAATQGLEVYINGRPSQMRTPAQISLAPGTYQVGVISEGMAFQQQVEVRDGSLTKVDLSRRP